MTTNPEELELRERLNLIETMIAEGRRSTESWGWTFVVVGVAFYIALAWSILGQSALAWPVTMVCMVVVVLTVGFSKGRKQKGTTIGNAVSSIWFAMGPSMLLLFPALSIAGRIDHHSFAAIVAAMMGAANAASSIILKWKAQFACAVVWWVATVAMCFGTEMQLLAVSVSTIFLCQIVFGIYAMISESRKQRSGGPVRGAIHA